MPVLLDNEDLSFPSYDEADENGIIAVGGDFSSDRLLLAYSAGIFPWPHDDLPLLWFFPDPRYVLEPKKLIISRSLRKYLKNTELKVVADRDFAAVIKACQTIRRADQPSTWISDEMVEGYIELHRLGFAHSIEAYRGNKLVGGLYGVSLGSIFFGESMFHRESNASKVCLVTLAAHLIEWQFTLIDCQMPTKNLENFGAEAISQDNFIAFLRESQKKCTKCGPWQLSLSPKQALGYF